METIAIIQIEKYEKVAAGIRSTRVVLTPKQRQHIIERRGQAFFDSYSVYFQEIAENPDYVFKDRAHANTAIASKTITVEGKHVNLVIRLAVQGEDGKENSIITAIVESDRRYAQRIRNNEALYKRT